METEWHNFLGLNPELWNWEIKGNWGQKFIVLCFLTLDATGQTLSILLPWLSNMMDCTLDCELKAVYSPPQASGIYAEREVEEIVRDSEDWIHRGKKTLQTQLKHEQKHGDCGSISLPAHFQARYSPSTVRGAPITDQEAISNWQLFPKGNLACFQWSLPGYTNHT